MRTGLDKLNHGSKFHSPTFNCSLTLKFETKIIKNRFFFFLLAEIKFNTSNKIELQTTVHTEQQKEILSSKITVSFYARSTFI